MSTHGEMWRDEAASNTGLPCFVPERGHPSGRRPGSAFRSYEGGQYLNSSTATSRSFGTGQPPLPRTRDQLIVVCGAPERWFCSSSPAMPAAQRCFTASWSCPRCCMYPGLEAGPTSFESADMQPLTRRTRQRRFRRTPVRSGHCCTRIARKVSLHQCRRMLADAVLVPTVSGSSAQLPRGSGRTL